MGLHYTPHYLFICWKFSIKKEKKRNKKTLVSSPVFMSRTFLIASHPFLSPQGVLLPLFSPLLSFHSTSISRHIFAGDTMLGTEGQVVHNLLGKTDGA